MRLDRWLSLQVFRPFCREGRDSRLPILMYHSISDDLEFRVSPYYRVATRPERFAEQMRWLKDQGYCGVSLREGLARMAEKKTNTPRPVVITFDDGFQDFHTSAWPVLQKFGFTATMYLPTALISDPRQSFTGRPCLNWDEVRDLRRQGVHFGSHTAHHPKLYTLPWEQIALELKNSKERLERELNEAIVSFSYPYAFPQEDRSFTRRFAALLRETGYGNAVTTVLGRARITDDPFCLKRLPVNSADDHALFAAKLAGAYDWLGTPQRWFRTLRRCIRGRARGCPKTPALRSALEANQPSGGSSL